MRARVHWLWCRGFKGALHTYQSEPFYSRGEAVDAAAVHHLLIPAEKERLMSGEVIDLAGHPNQKVEVLMCTCGKPDSHT